MNLHIQRLAFIASCVALTVTAMTFAVRAGILSNLNETLQLSDGQLGWVNATAFFGFPLATIVGGAFYEKLGARRLLIIAFFGHVVGLLLTATATGFLSLLLATFLIGLANGAVEAGCNPLITSLFPSNKTTMLNRFHVWFPAGIVVGSLLCLSMEELSIGWRTQVALLLVPTSIYGIFLVLLPKNVGKTSEQPLHHASAYRAMLSPMYLFALLCMTLTASTELLTQQWIERILTDTGASAMAILALITGTMAVGRYFAGPLVKTLNPIGVLLLSACFAYMGLTFMRFADGSQVYYAAIIFALGVTYFWPTMLGFVAETLPSTRALGLGGMGAAGMLAVGIWNPIIGAFIEAKNKSSSSSVAETLEVLSYFPLCLIVAFGGVFLIRFVVSKRATQKEVINDA
ncbi:MULTISPECIES: MFS transporter [Pseudoalteromonas]|uniref:Major facilitator superfamily (MFS) profile domain-containing protein n=1 Tax=Pseudoalteromonas amylolytica TaxID=1859457 RepID=A0A1S1MVL8_9GAMM|nr:MULTISPECIES: MFS transporter [Pseudoalteromonas]OHU90558.1 hypothetical protein BFC16_02830 [Pseudoalteromonas sp. JW3]OHU92820.1 hypothetical protein BET10_05065 [Pseudoalteromonas amylolytica]